LAHKEEFPGAPLCCWPRGAGNFPPHQINGTVKHRALFPALCGSFCGCWWLPAPLGRKVAIMIKEALTASWVAYKGASHAHFAVLKYCSIQDGQIYPTT